MIESQIILNKSTTKAVQKKRNISKVIFTIVLLCSLFVRAQSSREFIWEGKVQEYKLIERSKVVEKNSAKKISYVIGKEGNTYYIIFAHEKGLHFLEVNSDYIPTIEDNKIQLSKKQKNIYRVEFGITNKELTFYLPDHLKQKLPVKQYPKIDSDLDEDQKLKKVHISSIEDFYLSFKDLTFPIQFKMLLSSEPSINSKNTIDITNEYINYLLKDKQYNLAKHIFISFDTQEKQENYFKNHLGINNILFHAIENEDIAFISSIEVDYLKRLHEVDKDLKINSLGYSIIKLKPQAIRHLSQIISNTSTVLQDNKENKTYRYHEALQLVDNKVQSLNYFDRLVEAL